MRKRLFFWIVLFFLVVSVATQATIPEYIDAHTCAIPLNGSVERMVVAG